MGTPPASHSSAGQSGPDRRRRQSLPRTARLLHRREFDRAMREGIRVSDSQLTLWLYLRPDKGGARLGLIVGRRHGGAVHRNRLKRLLRNAFRMMRDDLADQGDFVLTPRPGAPLTLPAALQSVAVLAGRAVQGLTGRKAAHARSTARGDS